MLGKVTNMLNRAINLSEDKAWIYSVTQQKILTSIREFVLDQLAKGEDDKGQIVGVYSYATQSITGGRKIAGDPYNFDDTGAFKASIFAVPNKDKILVFADGQKPDEDILNKYGLRIIGLNEQHMMELGEMIKNDYIVYAKSVLYKG